MTSISGEAPRRHGGKVLADQLRLLGADRVFCVPGESYLAFLGSYTSSFDRYSVDPSVMWNVRGTLTLLLGREQSSTINLVALAVFVFGMSAIAWLWFRARRQSDDRQALAARFGLTIVISLLLSYFHSSLFAPSSFPPSSSSSYVLLLFPTSRARQYVVYTNATLTTGAQTCIKLK